jgi:glutamyl-tRNA synthetase
MRVDPLPHYRGRLAPSPTGAQHVGNARTYLIAWLAARAAGGSIVLRIEDIDSPRIKSGAGAQACADLAWLGLDWDEGPLTQSARLPDYEAALATLGERELVYPCVCSRSDVESAASAPHGGQEGPIYPGTCAGHRAADAKNLTAPYSWRFRSAADSLEFVDGLRGPVRVDAMDASGDFVVWKSAGTPAYQLAVVVDDAAMGVTQVIRGDDLIPSTPRQLQLYTALGLQPPRFVHVPLVVGPDGRRLAKRHGDTRLASLQRAGIRSADLIGLLAWSCGWIDRHEAITAQELIGQFRLDTIPRDPFVLTPTLLREIGFTAGATD